MKQFIPAEDLDFQRYKDSLKQYLRSQHNFTDYDFEGSNISVLIDLLTYNTYNNALYLNMTGSEAWVDSAQLRSSLVSHAKDLNYVPRSKSSAFCTVTIEITPEDSPTSIVVPQHYKLRTTNSAGEVVYFITDQPITISRDENGRYIADDVIVYQGEIVTEVYNVSGVEVVDGYAKYLQRYIIQSPNIDIKSLIVTVNGVEFSRQNNLFGITEISPIYFVSGWGDNQYAIEFGDGVFGQALSNGDVVNLTYRNTKGSGISGNYVLAKTSSIQGYDKISISNISRTTGGSDIESVESIRYAAPRYFQTQERAVTPQDYEILIKSEFPFIQDISVFGGEEIYQYGKMMITIKPEGRVDGISNKLRNQIIEYIKTKNKITEPIILDPEYFYVAISGKVFHGSQNSEEVRSQVTAALLELNDNELGGFNRNVYQSLITDTIVDSHQRINGCDVTLNLVKQWVPNIGANNLNFTCDNQIIASKNGAYSSANYYGITSNVFYIWRNQQAQPVIMRDDGIGNIHLHAVTESDELIRLGNMVVGTIDYATGSVSLMLDVHSFINTIDITMIPVDKSINIIRDKFVLLDSRYFDLEV